MASKRLGTSETVSVATYFLRPLRRALEAHGRDPLSVLAPFGLAEHPASTRIPFETAAAIWSAAAVALGDPTVGLRAARMLVPGDYGALEFAARSSPTLRSAFDRISRYHRLLNDRSEVLLQGHCVRYLRPGMEASMPAPYVEFVLATWVRVTRDLAERSSLLERILLPHGPPPDDTLHREVFGCEVRFGAGEAELHFVEGALDAPLPRGDGALASVLDRHTEALMEEIARGAQWTSRVSARVERRLADGTPRLEDVARDLGIPPRMLRRRLEGENTTFARVIDDIRRRLALKLAADPSLSLGEIAFFLGFSEPSAFHRAFRRWTGRTPRGEEPSPS